MKKILSLIMLLLPLSLMAKEATITLMADGKVYQTLKVETGKTIGEALENVYSPVSDPFNIYEGRWAKNGTGYPEDLSTEEVIAGDMTLYYHWMIYRGITKTYLKRITSRDEIEDYDNFYLVTADGKHAIASDSRDDWYSMSINENSYTISGLAMKFGTQKDVNVQGDSITIVDDNPLSGTLPFYFFDRSYDNYSKRYKALGNGIVTYGDNFAYQQGDGEPFFGHLSNRGRDDLGKAGYNFVWNLSFTADGYAKLENENFGYIYYSETANADGHNFRLSKSATPNLIAYKIVAEEGYKFTTSLAYNTVRINISAPEDMYVNVMTGAMSEENSTARQIYDEEGNSYVVVMKGYTLPVMALEGYDENLYKAEWSVSGEGTGKEGLFEMYGHEMQAYIVSPTGDCTVNFTLTEDKKKCTIGGKEVAYSPEGDIDVYNNGTVVINGSDITLNGADIQGGIASEVSRLNIELKDNSVITGGIDVADWMVFRNTNETATPKLTVYGGIHSSSEAEESPLNVWNIDLYVYPASSKAKALSKEGSSESIISGFSELNYDEEDYMMVLPKDGYYNTVTRMLCNSDGTPATQFVLIKKDHYNDYITGINTVQNAAPTAACKKFNNGQIIIEKGGNRYNAAGQLLK